MEMKRAVFTGLPSDYTLVGSLGFSEVHIKYGPWYVSIDKDIDIEDLFKVKYI